MKKFKDFIAEDIDTFISNDEFADYHKIDGERIKCVVDADISKERNINKETTNMGGVHYDEVSIFVDVKYFDREPSIDEKLSLDDHNYLVKNVSEAMGVYEIELKRAGY